MMKMSLVFVFIVILKFTSSCEIVCNGCDKYVNSIWVNVDVKGVDYKCLVEAYPFAESIDFDGRDLYCRNKKYFDLEILNGICIDGT